MKIQKGKNNSEIIFKDSYNLTPISLDALVSAFGLNIEEKLFFPHLANNPGNYDKILPCLPPISDYLAAGMMPSKRKKFDKYYEEHRNETFNLNEKLAEYCLNDVEILSAALLAFRAEFFEMSRKKFS